MARIAHRHRNGQSSVGRKHVFNQQTLPLELIQPRGAFECQFKVQCPARHHADGRNILYKQGAIRRDTKTARFGLEQESLVADAFTTPAPPASIIPSLNDSGPTAANYEPNIGDLLDAKSVTWKWYSGGWDAASCSSTLLPGTTLSNATGMTGSTAPKGSPYITALAGGKLAPGASATVKLKFDPPAIGGLDYQIQTVVDTAAP